MINYLYKKAIKFDGVLLRSSSCNVSTSHYKYLRCNGEVPVGAILDGARGGARGGDWKAGWGGGVVMLPTIWT